MKLNANKMECWLKFILPMIISILVYCPFPGFIDRGKILLVGNMGLYEYRPYVR